MSELMSRLGGTDINRMGFGCWQLAGAYELGGRANGYGNIDTNEAIQAVHTALDNGINFFDTAIAYGEGRSEKVLGDALASYKGKTKPVVCTKYGIVEGSGSDADDFSRDNLVRSVENSLKRLGLDKLGAILLHNPPDDFNFGNVDVAPFEKLKEQGLIESYGVSCRTQKGVANVLRHNFGNVIEAVYNPLDRRYANYFSNPDHAHYTFICRVPLASGFLSPRTLNEDRTFGSDDIRSNFNQEQVQWVTDSVRKLSFLDRMDGGITVSALRFQLSNPHNTVVIPGIRNMQQVRDAILAMKLGPLPAYTLQHIAEAVPEVFYRWR